MTIIVPRLTNSLILVYIPTLLICLICHLTVYFHEQYFEAVVAVNLTSLLCLITMFNRYSNVSLSVRIIFLPYFLFSSTIDIMKTSYIKYMDVWFFASLCVPFLEVMLVTVTDFVRREVGYKKDYIREYRRKKVKHKWDTHIGLNSKVLYAC